MADTPRQVPGGTDEPGEPAHGAAIERIVVRREAILGILRRAYERDLGRPAGKRLRVEELSR